MILYLIYKNNVYKVGNVNGGGGQGVALAREKLAGSIDGVGNIFSEKF